MVGCGRLILPPSDECALKGRSSFVSPGRSPGMAVPITSSALKGRTSCGGDVPHREVAWITTAQFVTNFGMLVADPVLQRCERPFRAGDFWGACPRAAPWADE